MIAQLSDWANEGRQGMPNRAAISLSGRGRDNSRGGQGS